MTPFLQTIPFPKIQLAKSSYWSHWMANNRVAMQRFHLQDCIRIRKIIHKWTPTRLSPRNYLTAESDWLCPSCHRSPKTPEHCLHCTSTNRHALWQKLKAQLSAVHIKHNLDPHLFQMLWLGMQTLDQPTDHTIDLYPPEYHPIFQSQSQIRWKQIYYGWFSKEWTHFASNNYPKIDATNLYAKILQIIWEHVLELWTSRNHNNAQTIKHFPPNMLSEINGIDASRDRLPLHTQQIIFKLSKEELLAKPKQYIQSWINHSKPLSKTNYDVIWIIKKEWIKKNYRKDNIHGFLVAKLQYNFSQHQFQTTIRCHNLVNILTFWVL